MQSKLAFPRPPERPPHRATVTQRKPAASAAAQRSEATEEELGKSTLLIQPWFVTLTYKEKGPKAAIELDWTSILAFVQETWKQAKIELTFAKGISVEVAASTPLGDYPKRQDFAEELHDKLRPKIKQRLELDKAPTIHLVFTPTYDRWGLTFRGDFVDGAGDVAFVATHESGVGKGEHLEPREDSFVKTCPHMGVALDTAHELGHMLSLEHVSPKPADSPKHLMHQALYHPVGFTDRILERENAQKNVKVSFKVVLTTRQTWDNSQMKVRTAWTFLHGNYLAAEEIKQARESAAFKRLAQ